MRHYTHIRSSTDLILKSDLVALGRTKLSSDTIQLGARRETETTLLFEIGKQTTVQLLSGLELMIESIGLGQRGLQLIILRSLIGKLILILTKLGLQRFDLLHCRLLLFNQHMKLSIELLQTVISIELSSLQNIPLQSVVQLVELLLLLKSQTFRCVSWSCLDGSS